MSNKEKKNICSKKNILIFIGVILIVIILCLILFPRNKEEDNVRFSKEYTTLSEDNVFVYKNSEEIIKILEHGTGVVLLGFPECPWCQKYVVYLNEVAKELDLEEIYYYNILEDRESNNDTYKKIVSILESYLQYDKEGNKRVYVPLVVGIKNGEIVGFDDETSYDTKGFENPDDYWNDEEVRDLKTKLTDIINNSNDNMCTSCNS